jgi:hypothetical protein
MCEQAQKTHAHGGERKSAVGRARGLIWVGCGGAEQTDDLDYAIRKKDTGKAAEALKVAQAKLDDLIKILG